MFQSCVKKHFDFDRISEDLEWNPNLAAPGIKASLTIRDILQDFDTMELFVEDESGFLYLMYHKHIFSAKASDFILIPDQSFANQTFLESDFSAIGFNSTSDTGMVPKSINQTFAVNGSQEIDSIIIKSADLNINIISDYLHTGKLVVRFPYMKKNGVVYSKTIPITDASGTFSASEYYTDLNGYTIDFSSGINQLPIEYELTLYNSGSIVNVADQAVVGISMSNIYYDEMYGYFGQDTMSFLDTLHLEIFDNTFQGTANFVDPHFNVYFKNSYGLPLKMQFSDFVTYTMPNAVTQTYDFTNDILLNPIDINSPTISQIGQAIDTDFVLDKNNSEVDNIVSTGPKYIYFGMQSYSNPDGNVAPYNENFITDESQFDLDVELELPLWGYASYFAVQDTTALDFAEIYEDFDFVEYLKLKINMCNGMPTEVEVQIYFVVLQEDSVTYAVVDSAFTPETRQVIASGTLDGDGKVIAKTFKFTELLFDKARLEKIKNVSHIFLRGSICTTNNATQNVKFYNDYSIDVKVGLQAKFNFDENDLD